MRRLTNWIDSFVEYTEGLPSPPLFRWWAGAAAVAGALERKCFTYVSDMNIYSNLYLMFVGPPASGKSIGAGEAKELIRMASDIRLGPDDANESSLYDRLQKALVVTPRPGLPPLMHHSLTVVLSELGTLIRPADIHICNALTNLYDCPETFDKGRRTTDDNFIEDCFLNILACTTPSYLGDIFTPRILDHGLPSRFILIYSDKTIKKPPLFRNAEQAEARIKTRARLKAHLIEDLKEINKMVGEFFWSNGAASLLSAWYEEGLAPVVDDPKFAWYNDRRLLHVVKTMMIVSASTRGDFIIEPDDLETARSMLLQTELDMPRALEFSSSNMLYTELVKMVRFVVVEHAKTGKGVPEWRLRRTISASVPFNMVEYMFDALIAQQEIRADGAAGNRVFTPGRPLQ